MSEDNVPEWPFPVTAPDKTPVELAYDRIQQVIMETGVKKLERDWALVGLEMKYAADRSKELAVYKNYYEAKVAWEQAQDPSTDNKAFLPAADRFQKAHLAVKKHRGDVRTD